MASSSAIDETFRSEERGSDRIEEDDDDREVGVSNSYSSSSTCGCNLFGFGSRRFRSGYVPLQPDRQSDEEMKQSWMVKKVKRFKEIIKAVAARKWRSFINQIINKRRTHVRFQYDPTSYALNFDEGGAAAGGQRRDFALPSASPIEMNRSQI